MDKKEIWVKITPELAGFNICPIYCISNMGNVGSIASGSFCKLKTKGGSLGVTTSEYNGKGNINIKLMVMKAFGTEQPGPDYTVVMKDPKGGYGIDNLEWKRKNKRPEKRHFTRHSIETIREAFRLLASEEYTMKEVSDATGISYPVVHNMANGKTWVELYNEYDIASKNIPKRHSNR